MPYPRSEKKWIFRKCPDDTSPEQVKKTALALHLPESIARLLALRGFTETRNIQDFLSPSLSQLPRPHLMKGMRQAVAILLEAVRKRKPLTVYGDFDADGVTSTALLYQFFSDLGVPLHIYIPDRLAEGYGLNSGAIHKIHANNMKNWGQPGVLLTADCGISDGEVVAEARGLGFQIIISDHHKPPEKLPPAHAVVNPLQTGCPFPCKDLAGVGVAFYLILGVRAELAANDHWPRNKIPNLKNCMDLVAIGTVADQVPVTGCNRIIVKAGLEILGRAGRTGLRELLENSRNCGTTVSVEDIAFRIAPRINAVGRIGSARTAVNLMNTDCPQQARQYAAELEEANNARKNLEADIFTEAVQMVSREVPENTDSLVLYKNDWHQGVLGIVASRLSSRFCRPAILLTDCGQEGIGVQTKLVKGSGRSVEGLDIHAAVSACQGMLHRFGGHAGAVGLTLPIDNIAAFRQRFAAGVRAQSEKYSTTPCLFIEMQTTLKELADREFLAAYTTLAPFGTGNPDPVFCMKAQKLVKPRLVGANHLRFTIIEAEKVMHGIGFGFGDLLETLQNSRMDIAFTLRLNSYMGQEKWEMNLLDLRPSLPEN